MVGGLDVREHGPGELAAVCGTVFQEPETQVVMGGVRAELELPLEHRGEPPGGGRAGGRGDRARARHRAPARAPHRHALGRRAAARGDRRRAWCTARALLLLDEPTSQLDPVAGDELVWLLRRLNEDWGTAVVVAEHRLERCLPAADRVIALVEGRIACDASPRELLAWAAEAMPALATPAARLFSLAGLPDRAGVGEGGARAVCARAACGWRAPGAPAPEARRREDAGAQAARRLARDRGRPDRAARARPALAPGERVALMGRNGAGKSTLLRLAKGLAEPTRGRIERAGEVALLLQNPGDYLIHEHAVEDAGARGVAAAGLAGREQANPRDLSGGERQRLALEVVLARRGPGGGAARRAHARHGPRPQGRAGRRASRQLADAGAAVVVATHDTEFAAAFADRVVLLGQGVVIADGSPAEVLGGGWHFSTEVARITGGAALLRRGRRALLTSGRRWRGELAARLAARARARRSRPASPGTSATRPPARVLALVAALAALAVVGRLAFAAIPNVKPTTDIVLFAGYALGAVPGFVVGAITALVSNIFLSQGPWTVWQMAGWGGVGVGGALLARAAARARAQPLRCWRRVCGLAGLAFGAWMDVYQWTLAARQDLDSYLAVVGAPRCRTTSPTRSATWSSAC